MGLSLNGVLFQMRLYKFDIGQMGFAWNGFMQNGHGLNGFCLKSVYANWTWVEWVLLQMVFYKTEIALNGFYFKMVLCKMEMALDGFCFKWFYSKWRWVEIWCSIWHQAWHKHPQCYSEKPSYALNNKIWRVLPHASTEIITSRTHAESKHSYNPFIHSNKRNLWLLHMHHHHHQ